MQVKDITTPTPTKTIKVREQERIVQRLAADARNGVECSSAVLPTGAIQTTYITHSTAVSLSKLPIDQQMHSSRTSWPSPRRPWGPGLNTPDRWPTMLDHNTVSKQLPKLNLVIQTFKTQIDRL